MNFHNSVSPFKLISNENLVNDYPSICMLKINTADINNELDMTYLVRQLLGALLLCLKSQGSDGIHTQVLFNNSKDEDFFIRKLFEKFNFKNLISNEEPDQQAMESSSTNNNYKILGRRIRFKVKQQTD
jgi:hypothetical protein